MKLSKIETLPKETAWHFWLRFLLRPIMITFGTKKISHWWNWNNTKFQPIEAIKIPGDKMVTPRDQNKQWSLIKVSLGSWKKCVVLQPKEINYKDWRVGFITTENDKIVSQYCNIIIHGQVKVLIGPEDTFFYGLDNRNNEIKIEAITYAHRADKKIKKIILL